ncbi:MAG: SpoIID/LytB domain-containing protein [Acidobacteria bacterium]|nr:SpoIID/LytB domain-containing protein [Acidobacteriota bacterium]
MRLLSRHSTFVGFAAGAVLLAFQSCTPAHAPLAVAPPAVLSSLRVPIIRVGIGTDFRSVEIVADQRVRLYQGGSGETYIGEASGQLYAELTGDAIVPGASTRYSVQAGAFALETDAVAFAEQIGKDSGQRASVGKVAAPKSGDLRLGPYETNADWADAMSVAEKRLYRVRVGPFPSRAEAQAALDFLATRGYPDCFIVEETTQVKPARTFRFSYSGGRLEQVAGGTIYLVPEGGSDAALKLGGKRYRGILTVRMNSANRLTVVNALNIEDYLRGVVPNELSPSSFPQIEALKAQAVAARTYALKNLGGFEGFDICSTPMCQVYEGASSEHVLSDRAVAETEGEVALYGGELINALYTSTCGGSTEYSEKIFEGKGAPYLRPVECYPEANVEYEIHSDVTAVEDPAAAELAVLRSLGVLDLSVANLAEPLTSDQAGMWTDAALAACHRKGVHAEAGDLVHLAPIATHLLDRFGWSEKRDRLAEPRDAELVLAPYADAASLVGEDRLSVAYLLSEKILLPTDESSLDVQTSLTHRRLVDLLYRLILTAEDPRRAGTFLRAGEKDIQIAIGADTKTYRLSEDLSLFDMQDPPRQRQRCILFGGERIQYVLNDRDEVAVLFVESLPGLANDRSSKYYRWEARLSRADLEAKIGRNYPVGELLDLEPLEIGESKRVTELLVKGSQREVLLRGIRIRWALGLRENLFVIDRIYDESGKIASFQFSGKGWGHGVGLCQVGSYGMALRGKSYREILQTYYPGTEISRR